MKKRVVLMLAGVISVMSVFPSFAAWEQVGNNWKYKDDKTGVYLTNQWYQDVDGSWYYLKTDGLMAEGLMKDGDYWYYLNPKHDGTYGRLMTTGTYDGISITTSDIHDGTWGHIINTESVEVIKSKGIVVDDVSNSSQSLQSQTETETSTQASIPDWMWDWSKGYNNCDGVDDVTGWKAGDSRGLPNLH